jgi:ring hydroxylating enzyme alpha subunit
VYGKGVVSYQRADPGPTPDSCRLTLGVYAWEPPTDSAAWKRAEAIADLLWRVVDDEDCWAQRHLQHSFESGLVPTIVFGANEPALHSLHANWDAALARA